MDPVHSREKVVMVFPGKDPGMGRALVVQPLEMSAIVGQHSAAERMSTGQNDRVRF